ncbi:MAG: glutamate 5-kinase [Planctomycetaceae bacterium]
MQNIVRQEVFQAAQTLIVKIGSNVLARDDDRLDRDRIQHLADQIDRLLATGRKVVLVSSGAVAAGVGILGLKRRPESLSELQAAAAVGQAHLIKAWDESLIRTGHHVGQILVTVNDFRNRRRYLNIRNTLRTLVGFGVVPVVNENDTVSIEEIALGDNDQLAAMIATLVPGPLLIILSGVDGLYDGPPSNPASTVIPLIKQPEDELLKLVANEQSSRGRGGMASKLKAILSATRTGESVLLAGGKRPHVLDEIREGLETGTLFLASGGIVPAWKKWIGYTAQPQGVLVLDDGACRAVCQQGRSLLAVGVREVRGDFDQGASVELVNVSGESIARGLANYSATEIRRIAGQKSANIGSVLGHVPYGEVIHRDNLVVTTPR